MAYLTEQINLSHASREQHNVGNPYALQTAIFQNIKICLRTPVDFPVRFKYTIVEGHYVAMPKVEITIPEHTEMQIAQLVEQGEFLNREEAIEDLLSTGLKAYKTSGPIDDEDDAGFEEDGMMGHDDDYVF